MVQKEENNVVLQLELPFTSVVSGATGVGKTHLVADLIRHQKEMFDKPIERIIWCYGMMQPLYRELASEIDNLTFEEGFPTEVSNHNQNLGQTLYIIDDLMEHSNDKLLASMFTRMRHANISTIFIVQNFYHGGKYMSEISRNAQYLFLFPNPRAKSMIDTLGRQMWPLKPKFLSTAFEMATHGNPYSYILVDLKPTTPEDLRVRQHILPGEQPIVFKPT